MKAEVTGLVVALVLAGCATISTLGPGPGAALLARADEQMATANYQAARDLYAEFLAAYGADAAAPRARATQAALDRLLVAQAEIERLRRELDSRDAELARLRSDIADRQHEAARLRPGAARDGNVERLRRDLADRQGEIDRLRAEVARLRADLERLRSIDLRPEPRR